MKRNIFIIALIAIASIAVVSCSDYERKPGRIYAPDMTYSRAHEYYGTDSVFANNLVAQAPVNGTIARGGYAPYRIAENDTNAAKANTCNIELSAADIEEGKRIYAIHCGVCHGNNLDGNGPLYNGGAGKFPAAPANFKDPKYLNMSVGTMYHAIMYGKNLMGSYASQLDVKQRWMILAYIKKFQSENGGSPFNMVNVNGGNNAAVKAEDKTVVVLKENGVKDTVQIEKIESADPIKDLKQASKK